MVSLSKLDVKLLRDLWRMRGQALAIALVMAGGVATLVIARSTIGSLEATREAFYREGRFADVFVSLKRAPAGVAGRLAAIPGVQQLETRVAARALLDVEGFPDPVSALMLSLPDPATGLNRLYLRAGRLPEGDREVAVNEAFATAHGLVPGDRLDATVNGRRRALTISGVVLSPEFVYLIRLGDVFPDYKRYGVLWMPRAPLAALAGMEGAFDDVVLTLQAGANERAVIGALDRELERWGGAGAIGRADQTSHRYLSDEVRQLQAEADVVPWLFLGVAAFLLHVVLSRLMAQERSQVAVLKAFGYGTPAIAWHYLKLALAIVLLGATAGILAGARLGSGLAALYSEFFRYPFLRYVLEPGVAAQAVAVSGLAALAGTLWAVSRAARVPPAVGMRPEPPPMFRRGSLGHPAFGLLLSPAGRMAARNLLRKPVKGLLTLLGIALAAATMTVGGFMEDTVNEILDIQFNRAHRADLTVTFDEVKGRAALHELAALPGVTAVEPLRAVPVRLRVGHRERRLALQGLAPGAQLHRLLDAELAPQAVPPAGLLLTDHLARRLGVMPGDRVTIERLEGDRAVREAPVVGFAHDVTGYGAYMDLDALNAWLGEGDVVSGAFVQAQPQDIGGLYAKLRDMPGVVGVMNRRIALNSFVETMGENLLIMGLVNLVLASSIAVGVVYNGMRTALSERAHELASLRVLGYTRGETTYVLLGEIAVLTLAAVPLGCAIGYEFCAYLADRLASELYRVPVALSPGTYGYAALVVLVTSLASAAVMAFQVRRLDLVGALKVAQ